MLYLCLSSQLLLFTLYYVHFDHSLCTGMPCTCCRLHPSHRCSRSLHRQQRSACKISGKHVGLLLSTNENKKQIYIVGQEREKMNQKDMALDRCWSMRGKPVVRVRVVGHRHPTILLIQDIMVWPWSMTIGHYHNHHDNHLSPPVNFINLPSSPSLITSNGIGGRPVGHKFMVASSKRILMIMKRKVNGTFEYQ